MSGRIPRWGCLTVLAACNLAFWLAVAIGVGLLASDKVDLGLESSVRAGQATIVALWQPVPPTAPPDTAPGPVNPSPPPLQREQEPPAGQRVVSASPTPPPTPVNLQRSFPPTMPPRPTALDTPALAAQATSQPGAAPTLAPNPATATPPPALASSLLPLTDPTAADWMRLDAEMSRSATGRPVQIQYSEAALNREISALLAENPDLPYQEVYADLKHDGVVLSGRVTVMGFQVNAEVSGQVTAQDCQPQVEIETISIAGLATPGFVRKGIEDIVLGSLDWYPADYPLCLEQIVLEEDQLTMYGSRR
jgi:hypothetical protein